MSTYRTRTAADDAPDEADPLRYLPCSGCRGSTPRATLSQYGARCHSCFEAWCAQGSGPATPTPRTRAERVAVLQAMRGLGASTATGTAWAQDLRQREASGEPLTAAQRRSWRMCLRVPADSLAMT